MRERLLANLRKLPQIVEGWNGPEDNDVQPSPFAKAVTKVLMLPNYQWEFILFWFSYKFLSVII
jgi:hypothetical protein